ncbi:MAG TPA: hypothetical protein QF683_16990, partial [SAR324 cluster bacterium]|nr:hypothetical protein [SAR324 cluster bacterium]
MRFRAEPTTTTPVFRLPCETTVGWDKRNVPNTFSSLFKHFHVGHNAMRFRAEPTTTTPVFRLPCETTVGWDK